MENAALRHPEQMVSENYFQQSPFVCEKRASCPQKGTPPASEVGGKELFFAVGRGTIFARMKGNHASRPHSGERRIS
jgi:hypothetical protein